MPRIRDFIETGPRGKYVHEAAAIREQGGASVYAVALCGATFGEDEEENWVRGFGADDRTTCPWCRLIAEHTRPAAPIVPLDLEAVRS